MIDINIINQTIQELENENITFASCQKLASLYVVRDHITDIVPDSNIDECIETLSSLFLTYYNSATVETLRPLLSTLQQILSELYHSCTTMDEQVEIKNFISNLNKIAT